jgi:hypothetical protein
VAAQATARGLMSWRAAQRETDGERTYHKDQREGERERERARAREREKKKEQQEREREQERGRERRRESNRDEESAQDGAGKKEEFRLGFF